MARYRKIEVQMWGDSKFRALSALPPCGQGLWLYLLTNVNTSPIPGLFRAGRAAIAEELGWSLEDFDKAFQEVFNQGMVKADFISRVVWIPNAIKHNRPESPNVVISWGKEIDLIPECTLKDEAISALYNHMQLIDSESDKPEKRSYSTAFEKAFGKALLKPFGKAMPNQEQEQEQEQDQEEDSSGHGSATPPDGGSSDEAPSEKPKSSYPEEFELAWREYPKRAGGNSKVDAFKAWTARIKSGATAQELTDGVRRYADYITAAGKLNTEYVKQASTFFGPSKHYEELWSFEVPTGKRDPNSISQPDKLIPSGFRG
ncbi:DNA-binding protein [Klebsiella pneumoniae subsp. ozaenae]